MTKEEQIAHDLAMFIMNHSHKMDNDGIDYTILDDEDLVIEYKKLYDKLLLSL